MSKDANVVPPMTPGEPPKKDNTLKIVIICLIVFIGVPLIAGIVIIVLTFSLAGGLLNHAINEFGVNSTIIEKSEGARISPDYADSLSDIYDMVSEGVSTYASRSYCQDAEYLISQETSKNFSICGDEGFKSYAYENMADDTYILGFYGVGDDSDYIAEIKLSESFLRYYNITIRKNTGAHDDEAVEVYYSSMKNYPLDCDSLDATEGESLDCAVPENTPQTEEKPNNTEEMQLDRA